jgi:hypothetical protein
MLDYFKRFLIAIIMGLCVSLLFLGGKHFETSMSDMKGNNHYYMVNSVPSTSQTQSFSV